VQVFEVTRGNDGFDYDARSDSEAARQAEWQAGTVVIPQRECAMV